MISEKDDWPLATNAVRHVFCIPKHIFINTNKSYADETNEEHPGFGIRNAKVNECINIGLLGQLRLRLRRKRGNQQKMKEKKHRSCVYFFQIFIYLCVYSVP